MAWRTGEIFLQKPDVASERRNIIHYLYTVFPDVLPVLDVRLQQSWEYCGFDPDLLRSRRTYLSSGLALGLGEIVTDTHSSRLKSPRDVRLTYKNMPCNCSNTNCQSSPTS